jgi:DnaJ-class molecular chaperone
MNFQPPDPPESEIDTCDACGGTGESESRYLDGSPQPCGECKGKGLVLKYLSGESDVDSHA